MERFTNPDKEKALNAIADMIERSMKARAKFAVGTPQYSLQENRIHALRVSAALILQSLSASELDYEYEDLKRAKAPISSLLQKSEKAQSKLAENSWQHKMLIRNLNALYIASELLEKAQNESRGKRK